MLRAVYFTKLALKEAISLDQLSRKEVSFGHFSEKKFPSIPKKAERLKLSEMTKIAFKFY